MEQVSLIRGGGVIRPFGKGAGRAMMRRLAGLALAAMAVCTAGSAPAAAQDTAENCNIYFVGADYTLVALRAHFRDFEGYTALCATLRERGFGVSIVDGHGMVGVDKFGSVLVRLFDQQTGVKGRYYITGSLFTQEPADEIEAELLCETVIGALQEMAAGPSPFISSVDTEIVRLRAYFGAGA